MSIVLADKVFPEIAAWGDELTAIRREIHSHPELGFDTAVTVSRIVTLLKKWGIEKIDTDIVKGGVIVEIDGNRPGKTVALRADIDALPMTAWELAAFRGLLAIGAPVLILIVLVTGL